MTEPTSEPDPTPHSHESSGEQPEPTEQAAHPRVRTNGRRNGGLLAERVSKLEFAVAELRVTQPTEEAVADRVITRLTAMAAEPRRILTEPRIAPDGSMSSSPTMLLGASSETDSPPGLIPVPTMVPEPLPPSEPPLPLDPPVPPPSGAVIRPPTTPEGERRTWFLPQLLSELRLTAVMYFDSRYRISRTAQVLMPLTVVLFVLNYFLFSVWLPVPFIGPVLERVVCVLLGVFFYKVMTRELARYKDVLDYLTKYGLR